MRQNQGGNSPAKIVSKPISYLLIQGFTLTRLIARASAKALLFILCGLLSVLILD